MSAWTLLTGGAGFIGSELVAQLVAEGRRVRVLDNLETGARKNLDGVACELLVGDVRDPSALRAALADVSDVFHLACLGLRRSLGDAEESHDVNATGTLRLLVEARRAGVRRFVHVSSCEVYGSNAGPGVMDEDHPTRPTTPYGAAKLAGEAYARSFHLVHGLPLVIVRPFNTYGPRSHHEGDAGEVIPRFVVQALAGQPLLLFGDGRQTRDFTHVRDVARGLRLAAKCDAAIGATLNLGSGREIAIADLAQEVRVLCGCPDLPILHEPRRPGDLRGLLADASRACRQLGWTPEVDWKEGLQEVKEWFASRPETPQELVSQQAGSQPWIQIAPRLGRGAVLE